MISLKPLLIGGIGLPILGGAGYACFVFIQPKNLKEELKRDKFTPLSIEKGQDKDIWTKLVKEYSKTTTNPKIGNLTITLSATEPTDEEIEKLQNACKGLFEKKKGDSNYETDLNLAKNWCIKESTKISNTPNIISNPAPAGSEAKPSVP
ncbi:hypothetical protein A6V39_00325 [Candidatus Mycoplasma haematobovis]|uniref:Uncharacterized protein n=1 Tax=Candidatus Mycoplasma haematobovis TaxID=432608 RepID=A0A1A9QEV5_9MOLU|nr:hypothetical protein [Candidatus Mycoplasma haematobovis]OAL10495.1 hypothetical protein A6V39_00325 [Candidatus Mycoplasma haematobovis]